MPSLFSWRPERQTEVLQKKTRFLPNCAALKKLQLLWRWLMHRMRDYTPRTLKLSVPNLKERAPPDGWHWRNVEGCDLQGRKLPVLPRPLLGRQGRRSRRHRLFCKESGHKKTLRRSDRALRRGKWDSRSIVVGWFGWAFGFSVPPPEKTAYVGVQRLEPWHCRRSVKHSPRKNVHQATPRNNVAVRTLYEKSKVRPERMGK